MPLVRVYVCSSIPARVSLQPAQTAAAAHPWSRFDGATRSGLLKRWHLLQHNTFEQPDQSLAARTLAGLQELAATEAQDWVATLFEVRLGLAACSGLQARHALPLPPPAFASRHRRCF